MDAVEVKNTCSELITCLQDDLYVSDVGLVDGLIEEGYISSNDWQAIHGVHRHKKKVKILIRSLAKSKNPLEAFKCLARLLERSHEHLIPSVKPILERHEITKKSGSRFSDDYFQKTCSVSVATKTYPTGTSIPVVGIHGCINECVANGRVAAENEDCEQSFNLNGSINESKFSKEQFIGNDLSSTLSKPGEVGRYSSYNGATVQATENSWYSDTNNNISRDYQLIRDVKTLEASSLTKTYRNEYSQSNGPSQKEEGSLSAGIQPEGISGRRHTQSAECTPPFLVNGQDYLQNQIQEDQLYRSVEENDERYGRSATENSFYGFDELDWSYIPSCPEGLFNVVDSTKLDLHKDGCTANRDDMLYSYDNNFDDILLPRGCSAKPLNENREEHHGEHAQNVRNMCPGISNYSNPISPFRDKENVCGEENSYHQDVGNESPELFCSECSANRETNEQISKLVHSNFSGNSEDVWLKDGYTANFNNAGDKEQQNNDDCFNTAISCPKRYRQNEKRRFTRCRTNTGDFRSVKNTETVCHNCDQLHPKFDQPIQKQSNRVVIQKVEKTDKIPINSSKGTEYEMSTLARNNMYGKLGNRYEEDHTQTAMVVLSSSSSESEMNTEVSTSELEEDELKVFDEVIKNGGNISDIVDECIQSGFLSSDDYNLIHGTYNKRRKTAILVRLLSESSHKGAPKSECVIRRQLSEPVMRGRDEIDAFVMTKHNEYIRDRVISASLHVLSPSGQIVIQNLDVVFDKFNKMLNNGVLKIDNLPEDPNVQCIIHYLQACDNLYAAKFDAAKEHIKIADKMLTSTEYPTQLRSEIFTAKTWLCLRTNKLGKMLRMLEENEQYVKSFPDHWPNKAKGWFYYDFARCYEALLQRELFIGVDEKRRKTRELYQQSVIKCAKQAIDYFKCSDSSDGPIGSGFALCQIADIHLLIYARTQIHKISISNEDIEAANYAITRVEQLPGGIPDVLKTSYLLSKCRYSIRTGDMDKAFALANESLDLSKRLDLIQELEYAHHLIDHIESVTTKNYTLALVPPTVPSETECSDLTD